MNTLLNFLFLPGILLIGALSALSDIKTGKVKNSLIKKGFYYGLIVYSLLFVWTIARKYSGLLSIFFGKTYYLSFNYFLDLFINTIIALMVGIILWKLDFWAAGDAKLFTLFSFLIPLTFYSHDKIIYFPSFVLLLNIYMISFFALIFVGFSKIRFKKIDPPNLFKKFKQKITDYLKKLPENFHINNILNFINLMLIYSIIFSIIFSLNFKINILKFSLSSQLLVYLVLFLVYKPLSKLLTKYKKINPFIFPVLIIISFFISGFWVNFFSKLNPFIRFFGGFFIFIIAIQLATKFVSNQTETKKIKSEELRPNMLLGEETINLLKQDKDFFQKDLEQMYFDGLSEEQVEKIKNFIQNKNLNEIEIYKTFPFAPFIFGGTIITLILQGSLLNWLMQLWR
jgi:hypothetical protein